MKMLFVAVALVCTSVSASIVPKNNLSIPKGMKSAGGLTEEQFNSVITKLETIYSPLVKEITGNELQFKKQWESPTVNAYADRYGNSAIVNVYGGLARHTSVTKDSFALVLCHELGHHIGGAPKVTGWYPEWATIESQADYFATLKCLRRVFLNDDNKAAVKDASIPKELKENCTRNFKDDDQDICVRSGLAALDLQKLLMFIRGDKTEGSFSTPDPTVVAHTDESHSGTQCRLDTFFQGAICEVPFSEEVSQKDEVTGTCHAKNGHTSGLRPACWFVPAE